MGSRSFLFLCRAELVEQVATLGEPSNERIGRRIATTVEEALYEMLVDVPLALFVELSTSLRLAAAQRTAILSLGVRWPIVRFVLRGDGNAAVMGPPQSGLNSDWSTMATEVADGSTKWDQPGLRRQHIRLSVRSRCRIRKPGETWHPGHTLDLGCNGAFFLTYDTWKEGDAIEAELLDLLPQPLALKGRVVAFRGWDQSAEFPGIGVEFALDTPHALLARQLAKAEYLSWPKHNTSVGDSD